MGLIIMVGFDICQIGVMLAYMGLPLVNDFINGEELLRGIKKI